VGGRWNPVRLPAIYASRVYEGDLLEQLVHAASGQLPRDRVASRIVIPDDMEVPTVDVADHPGWRDEVRSREIGGAWVSSQRSVALFGAFLRGPALGMERRDQSQPSGVRAGGRCGGCRRTLGSAGHVSQFEGGVHGGGDS
jgi:hypothetical protein